jgi:hypothetical protein
MFIPQVASTSIFACNPETHVPQLIIRKSTKRWWLEPDEEEEMQHVEVPSKKTKM